MAESETQAQYLIRLIDHEERRWYLGERENVGLSLLHPSEMDDEHCPRPVIYPPNPEGLINAAPVTLFLGVRDGHIPWRNFELHKDYAKALERLTELMDIGIVLPHDPPFGADPWDEYQLSQIKFEQLADRTNPIYDGETGGATGALLTFRSNVFVELCSTRFEDNPDHKEQRLDEQGRPSYQVTVGEAYIVRALIRYPLTYRRKTNEQPKAVRQDQQVSQLRTAP